MNVVTAQYSFMKRNSVRIYYISEFLFLVSLCIARCFASPITLQQVISIAALLVGKFSLVLGISIENVNGLIALLLERKLIPIQFSICRAYAAQFGYMGQVDQKRNVYVNGQAELVTSHIRARSNLIRMTSQ